MNEEQTELSMQIFLGRGIPAAEINNTMDSVPVYVFQQSPMFAELSPGQATQWAAQLRLLAEQFDRWAREMQPAVCFPLTGTEVSNGL